jgi:predicted RNA-binding Zn-ribbon protein involved in translation (DUF1610 family)
MKQISTTHHLTTIGTSYLQPHGTEVILLYKLPGNTGIFVDPYNGLSPFVKARYGFDEQNNIILYEMDRYESITEALQKIKNPLQLHVTVTYHCRSCGEGFYKDYTVTDIDTLSQMLSETKNVCPNCSEETYVPIQICRDDGSEYYDI